MSYLLKGTQKPLHYFDISLEVTLKNLLSLVKETLGIEESENEPGIDKKPPKKKNWIKIIFLILLAILFSVAIFQGDTNNKIVENSSLQVKDEKYRQFLKQREFVIDKFLIEFWRYSYLYKIDNPKDFNENDKEELKERLWKVIEEGRRTFLNIPGMSDLEMKVTNYYIRKRFENDFDSFMATFKSNYMKGFEQEFVEYMKEKQEEIYAMTNSQ